MKHLSFILLIILLYNCGLHAQCPTGNIAFNSQQTIDDFATNHPGCTEIEGSLFISSSTITDLTPLNSLTLVTGDVTIYANDNLNTLSGLENIDSIGGNLIIGTPVLLSYIPEPGNSNLTDLTGLEGLRYIGGDLEIINNANLQTTNGLSSLNAIEGSLIIGRMFNHEPHWYADASTFYILGNDNLTNLNGLENLSHIGENVQIIANPVLSNLQGLGGLSAINGDFIFYANHNIANFSGLNLTSIGGNFVLHREKYLCVWADFAQEYECDHNHYGNDALINFEGLESLTEINGSLIAAHNNDLLNFEGLNNLSTIGGDMWIGYQTTSYRMGNEELTSLSGLENLATVNGQFSVLQNTTLNNLSDLPNLDHTGITELNLIDNTNLSVCEEAFVCAHLANGGLHIIQNNAEGCNTLEEVEQACLDVLPIEMTDPLSVYLDGRVAILRWRTDTETNNAGFDVQRSKDGINWEKIAWQNGQGTTTSPHRYTHTDTDPLSGTSYYRLKQVDFDENFEYSNIVSLHYHKPERINVYPVPAKDFVVFDIPNITAADDIVLYDIMGKQISRQAFPQDKKLVVSHLNDGVYIYRIFYDNEMYSGKIVVE